MPVTNAIERLDLPFSLHAVLVERLLQAAILRRRGHFGRVFRISLLGEIDVLQRMQEQVA
jgi:hypothetical protein